MLHRNGNRARSLILSLEYRNERPTWIHVSQRSTASRQFRAYSNNDRGRRRQWLKRKRRENTRWRERDCKENVVEGVLNATVISD